MRSLRILKNQDNYSSIKFRHFRDLPRVLHSSASGRADMIVFLTQTSIQAPGFRARDVVTAVSSQLREEMLVKRL